VSRSSARIDLSTILGTEAPELSDATFRLLRDLIETRTGVFFDEDKRLLLVDKLAELVASSGMNSFLEYYYALRYDDPRGERTAALFDRLAVPETYFWRQPEHFTTLASVIAPAFFESHPGETLRIWSAACCTGEETVSIAMALAEAGLLDSRPIEIVGTDASKAMIDTALSAVYSERSFRQLPKNLKDKYFELDGRGGWRPKRRLMDRIQYEVANLTTASTLARWATSHVIFCRNVFIYFSDATIRATANQIARTMPPDGYLFVGAAESLTRLGVDLELAQIRDAFVYVRPGRRAVIESGKTSVPGGKS
jgi:chemotaxis protein methyltransferase CheR